MPRKIVKEIEARNDAKSWWWVAVAANGEVLCSSETYSTKKKREKTGRAVAEQLSVPYVEA